MATQTKTKVKPTIDFDDKSDPLTVAAVCAISDAKAWDEAVAEYVQADTASAWAKGDAALKAVPFAPQGGPGPTHGSPTADALQRFADEVEDTVDRVERYRTVASRWDDSWRRSHESLSWTIHYMLGQFDDRVEVLEQLLADNPKLTTRDVQRYLSERKGEAAPAWTEPVSVAREFKATVILEYLDGADAQLKGIIATDFAKVPQVVKDAYLKRAQEHLVLAQELVDLLTAG